MYKKTVKYEDFNGEEIQEDLYFNLTKTELAMWGASRNGNFSEYLTKIVNTKNITALFEMLREIVLTAYGERSEDGKHFYKSPEIANEFANSIAFDTVMMELIGDAGAASAFVTGIIPADIRNSTEFTEKLAE